MTKETIYNAVASALDGETSPMEVYDYLTQLKDAIDESMEQLKPLAIDELEKYKERTIGSTCYKIKNGAGRWDYSNVTQLTELKAREKQLQELAKIASKNKTDIMIDENGEPIKAATYNEGSRTIYKSKTN